MAALKRQGVYIGAAEVERAEAEGSQLCRMDNCTIGGVTYDLVAWEPGRDPFTVLGSRADRQAQGVWAWSDAVPHGRSARADDTGGCDGPQAQRVR